MTNEPLTAEEFKTNAAAISYHFTRSGDPDDMAELEEAIEAYAAQEVAKATAGTPIPHNGKLYYPDANGWYEMECLKKHEQVMVNRPSGYWFGAKASDGSIGVRFGDDWKIVTDANGWQPLPAGPVLGEGW